MKVSRDRNRYYHKLLQDLQPVYGKEISSKEFREKIKYITPQFPVDKDGKAQSMRDLEPIEFEKFVTFLKVMAIKHGVVSELLTEEDYQLAEGVVYPMQIVSHKIEKKINIVAVTCSRCGCISTKGIEDDRLNELHLIIKGEKQERFDNLMNSFVCLKCFAQLTTKGTE